jgi:hypothetical protein
MKLYTCGRCYNRLYFENSVCLNCGSPLGFDSMGTSLITLESGNGNNFSDVRHRDQIYRRCENAIRGTCNWLIPSYSPSTYCVACELNRIIPALNSPENLVRWKKIEIAKHRLVFSLLRLQLPFESKKGDEDYGIAFDFMADLSPQNRVMTGHEHGTITLNIEEADEAERVKHKLDLGERYRTLLGHFRHEIGHYYWEQLIEHSPDLTRFRQVFGDERIDYDESIKKYYENGPLVNWEKDFISPYATSHPWEDWAETWSHYFHLMDTLETSNSFGIIIQDEAVGQNVQISKDPYGLVDFTEIFNMWLPLTFAINSLNRSMGYDDFYAFLISPHVMGKLSFIHEICLKQKKMFK